MTKYYCYWDVRTNTDFIITLLNLVITLVVGVFGLLSYIKSYKYLKIGQMRIIFVFIGLWWISKDVLKIVYAT